MPIKVLHISIADSRNGGGSSIAAVNLHNAINRNSLEIESHMLVAQQYSSEKYVYSCYNTKLKKIIYKIRNKLSTIIDKKLLKGEKLIYSSSIIPFSLIPTFVKNFKPDLVHFHWTQGGFMFLTDYLKVKTPLVITMHDYWLINEFNHLYTNQGLKSSLYLKIKQRIINKANPTIITLSNFQFQTVENSKVIPQKNIFLIPNLINLGTFKKQDKALCRKHFKLDNSAKYVLSGSLILNQPWKGFNLLLEALNYAEKDEFQLVTFGSVDQPYIGQKHIPFINTGLINEPEELAMLYSAVDLVVIPSLQETFGQIAAEALSCEVPVVAFNNTALKDIISHGITGYLADDGDSHDLYNGIKWGLNINSEEIGLKCRNSILERYSEHIIVPKLTNLYKSIIKS